MKQMSEEELKAYWDSVKNGEVKVGCTNPILHETDYGEPCDKCTAEVLEMMGTREDEGPWVVDVWTNPDKTTAVVVATEDFRHDAALIVTGDFWDLDQKKAYAQLIADKLNRRDVTLS